MKATLHLQRSQKLNSPATSTHIHEDCLRGRRSDELPKGLVVDASNCVREKVVYCLSGGHFKRLLLVLAVLRYEVVEGPGGLPA